MNQALTSLRLEINRERAYCRSTRMNIERGFDVSYTTKTISGIRWQNVVMLKKAIKALKKIKPQYHWLSPAIDFS